MNKYAEYYNFERTSFISSDTKTEIAAFFYTPKTGLVRGVVQLCHGMCEYMRRYDEFAGILCKNGFAFCGHDHLGHGESTKSKEELGFTAQGGGADYLIEDAHKMTELVREKFPNVPLVLAGHSMGSFIARAYLSRYPNEKLKGALISGTSGAQSATALGKAIARFYMKFYGENYRSKFLKNLSFLGYNKKCPRGSSTFAWISTDKEIVEKYESDEYCQFTFTVRAYYDLFRVLEEVSTADWVSKLKADLPVFLISGCDDPVGQYGRGACQVYERMKNTGMRELSIKVYSGMRHEVLNEINREKVYSDVIKWLDKTIKKSD